MVWYVGNHFPAVVDCLEEIRGDFSKAVCHTLLAITIMSLFTLFDQLSRFVSCFSFYLTEFPTELLRHVWISNCNIIENCNTQNSGAAAFLIKVKWFTTYYYVAQRRHRADKPFSFLVSENAKQEWPHTYHHLCQTKCNRIILHVCLLHTVKMFVQIVALPDLIKCLRWQKYLVCYSMTTMILC